MVRKLKLNNLFFILSIILLFFIASCKNKPNEDLEFKKMCTDSGYEWMKMRPTQNGKIIKDSNDCLGCMVGLEHICDKEKFEEFVKQK